MKHGFYETTRAFASTRHGSVANQAMFHRLLIPVKPEPKPHVALETVARLCRADDARLIFLVVEIDADIALRGHSAAFSIVHIHERRDRAEAALRWIREQSIMAELAIETLHARDNVLETILELTSERRCDAIGLTLRKKAWARSTGGSYRVMRSLDDPPFPYSS